MKAHLLFRFGFKFYYLYEGFIDCLVEGIPLLGTPLWHKIFLIHKVSPCLITSVFFYSLLDVGIQKQEPCFILCFA